MPAPGRRPRIGVTGPSRRLTPGRWAACLAVRLAGGDPVPLAPDRPAPDAQLRGIIITGGSDIHPHLFGHDGAPWSPPDPIRDEYELAALSFARLNQLPVLGICRGAQLMNVFAGGNLHIDITHMREKTSNRRSLLPRKTVQVRRNCRLAEALGSEQVRVNSLHHQAVDSLGKGLTAVAHDRDGIIQGIEDEDHEFFVGVQWHPEYLLWKRAQRGLFAALIRAAG